MPTSAALQPPNHAEARGRREAALVTTLAAVAMIVAAASVVVAGESSSNGLQMPGFPGPTVQSTLFMGGENGVEGLFFAPFSVSAPSTPNSLTKVGVAVAVNVTCGRGWHYSGGNFSCSVWLFSNFGSPNEVQEWWIPFAGSVTSAVTPLPAGKYMLIVDVVSGAAPAAEILVPYCVVAEVMVLN